MPTTGLNIRITWGDKANDLELHVIRKGGIINNNLNPNYTAANQMWDCTGSNMRPDWGVPGTAGNAWKDVDWISINGAETVYMDSPERVTYEVYVEYKGAPVSAVDASTTFSLRFVYNGMTVLSSGTLSPKEVSHAASITLTPTGFSYTNNLGVVSCAADWNNGCMLPLQ